VPFPTPNAPGRRAHGPAGLGLVLPTFPQDGALLTGAELAALCHDAEDAGAAGLWACDHLFWHGPSMECFTALSVAAQATQRCLVGSCVLQLPLRRAPAVAKTAASLQQLAAGRFVLGVGVGTHQGEYEAAGVEYHRRGSLLDEGLADLQRAWSGTQAAHYAQLPVPSPVPLWVGGSSAAARRRAAAHDGWVPLFLSPDEYGDALRGVRAGAEKLDRDPAAVAGAVVAFAAVGRDRAEAGEDGLRWMSSLYGLPPRAFARHLLAGDARAVAEGLARWVEHGAQHVAVFLTDDRPSTKFTDLAREFADLGAAPALAAPAGHPVAGAR
jgi:alkanesulfonate monooxygenase SsuD/methylene tetrahydromethanopterin reductase-like flavin-dependent oxidoreductase (luciferase family)